MPDSPVSTRDSAPVSPVPAKRKRNVIVRVVSAHWVPLVIAALAVLFIAQNRDEVSVDLFWAHLTSPLWLFLAVMTVAGLVIGVLAARRRTRQAGQR